jgi:hypothetical protein
MWNDRVSSLGDNTGKCRKEEQCCSSSSMEDFLHVYVVDVLEFSLGFVNDNCC